MHIVFGIERNVEVENGWHVFDVQAARCHVGTDQQIDRAAFEGFQGFQAFVLGFIAVQCGRVEAFALQRARQPRATELAVHEHKRLLQAAIAQNLAQRAAFVVVINSVKMLLHRGGGGVGTRHLDRHRILQVAAGQALDLGRESGREQQGGALFGQVAQDALQIGQKADVQHAVCFVEHHILDLVEHAVLGFDVVQQTAWRGHQHLDPFFKLCCLRLHVHTAKHHHAAQLGVFGIKRDLLGHLVGQLARGQQHQSAHRVARGRGGGVFVLEHALQQGQREGGGFAGAGLGSAHHVAAFKNHGDGLRLNRRHGFIAHFGHGAGD